MNRQSQRQSIASKKKYLVTRRKTETGWEVVSASAVCVECGKPFDPFDVQNFTEVFEGRCGDEDCHVGNLVHLGIRGKYQPWVKHRAPSSQQHLRNKLGESQSLSSISEERQRRLDSVRELWDAGLSPMEIGEQLGHKHTLIYHDLEALGIDPKPRATEAREQLHERIGQLLSEGMQYKEIAPIVGLTPTQVGYIGRTHFKLDGRKRQAAHRTPAAIGI